MRFFNHLMQEKITWRDVPSFSLRESLEDDIYSWDFPELPKIIMDDVVNQLQRYADYDPCDFPFCMPPFDRFWIETRGTALVGGAEEYEGALVNLHDFRDGVQIYSIKAFDRHNGTNRFIGGLGSMCFQDSVFVGIWRGGGSGSLMGDDLLSDPLVARLRNPRSVAFTDAVQYTMALMNCVNVELYEPKESRKLASKRFRKGKPVYRYHILRVLPLRAHGGGSIRHESSGANALHVCRGHFADYREGNGLFGKHHGVYYIGPHLRGNRASGIVEKDYEVFAPK